jgi:hypothetical protein
MCQIPTKSRIVRAYRTGIGISGKVMHKAGTGIAIYVEPPATN